MFKLSTISRLATIALGASVLCTLPVHAQADPAKDYPSKPVRFIAPFDPVVWDRRRFESFWGWAYRFEAYTPAPKRVRGYYALPLLWRDQVIGWGNLSVREGVLDADVGYVTAVAPVANGFRDALDAELERVRRFLALS